MTTISERLESLPMSKMTWSILLIIGIGWMFDAMDQGMVSGVLKMVQNDWGLSMFELSWMTSAGIFGMIIGAALSGALSDRFGRRTVVLYTLLIYSIGSFLCGIADNYWMMIIFRFITGFGLGGELPAASTLVSELSPLKSRGRNVIILESFWAWGWILASMVAYLVIPAYGWRMAFFIGAVPALFAAILRFKIPESPRYLELSGQRDKALKVITDMENAADVRFDGEDTPLKVSEKKAWYEEFKMLWSRANLRTTTVLWIIWFGINFGYYGFVLWTPTLLFEQGFDIVKSFEFTMIMCFAQLPGYFCAAVLFERWGRKPTLILFFAGTAVAAWLFGHSDTETMILATGCLLYFFALGAWGCVYSYTPELYPTDVRGSGNGWASAFGRIGAFIAPFVVPILYSGFGTDDGFTMVFIILSMAFAFVAVIVAVFGKETKGQSLMDKSE